MAERRRRKITTQDKDHFVRAFENQDQDYLTLADTFDIPRLTAWSIVFCYYRECKIQLGFLKEANSIVQFPYTSVASIFGRLEAFDVHPLATVHIVKCTAKNKGISQFIEQVHLFLIWYIMGLG